MSLPAPRVAPALRLDDAELRRAFLDWSLSHRHNTVRYVRELESYLAWWGAELGGLELHALSLLAHVMPALDKLRRGRAPRISALKSFCGWLCRERFLLPVDPTAPLKVPQARPAQWRRAKVVPDDLVRAAELELPSWAAAAVVVLAGTGWHVTELERFARSGAVAEPNTPALQLAQRRGRVAGVLETVHKYGEVFRTPVSAPVRRAAELLRAHGRCPATSLRKALRRACGRAGVERWTPGRLRHTVATWAVQRGATLGDVADFLHHKDPRTTRRFYVLHHVPPKVPTPR